MQEQVGVLEKNLQDKTSDIKKIENTIESINTYKQLRAKRPILSENINTVLSSIPNSTVLKHVKAQTDSVSISVDSGSPLDVALIISKFLENKDVQQIILNKVEFDVAKNLYSSDISVEFK
ncbi:hypothetical protein A3H26_02995 [candidate division WWE3 bacterium RIFCSPLOWO2_12_FULL_36_10]|uniref:Uncharacterized protein n=1 Tax=candidate division WWE3 bacterium RIFCSPLOWO2_12_FULL_36_10 TaxID=1802630 RepID=A0A1F4VJA0_UNCKA|nr:MAG: hypothetical protein A3H26_02995 [candidate division WWE3 bacterium RIFCSPLOWO2_12_FULL_36_10]